MPTFVAETDRILSDPANYPSKQMDIVITEHPASAVSTSEPDAPLVVGKPGQIQMVTTQEPNLCVGYWRGDIWRAS